MNVDYKAYMPEICRPKVLLLGNGIPSLSNYALTWKEVLLKLKYDKEEPQDIFEKYKDIPNSVLATIMASSTDSNRRMRYVNIFSGREYPYDVLPTMNELVRIPFDAILTTNYTYEIENAIRSDFYKKQYKSLFYTTEEKKENTEKDSLTSEKKKNKEPGLYGHISLFKFNRMKVDNSITQDIWHIHGEIRNKSSIVLTHDEYARLTRAILNYTSQKGKSYFADEKIKYKSWVDYMIFGDLYIVGQSFDPSEFDLWWLLSRRIRDKRYNGIGKVVYYEPEAFMSKGKINALETMGVECRNLGYAIPQTDCKEKKKAFFQLFYQAVIDDLRLEVTKACI